jgi:hypothetical protein
VTAAVERLCLLVATALAAASAASCTIDQSENPAYRACNDRSSCGADEHCYRGYCVPEGDESASASIAKGDAGDSRSLNAARDAAGPESASAPMSKPNDHAGSAADATVSESDQQPPAMSLSPPSGDASAPAAGTSAPEPPRAGSASPPPQQPSPDAGNPTTPPPADAGATTPPPPPPDTCHAAPREQCNGQDDDCDHKTDEDFKLDSDPANCGRCGRVCANGSACCGGECVPTNTAAHCGSCDHVCTGLLQACCEGECKTLCLL